MNVNTDWKIRQIIVTQSGWKAVHCRESDNGQIEISNRAVVCWALVEANGENDALRTEVRGIEQESNHLVVVGDLIKKDNVGVKGVDGNHYFLGYNDPDAHQESDYWIKQAHLRIKMEKDKIAQQ